MGIPIRDKDHVLSELKNVEAADGEGLMLKNPTGFYESRRSWNLLKVKSSLDDDATIEKLIYYNMAKTSDKKRLKGLLVKGDNGQQFRLRNGVSVDLHKKNLVAGMKLTFKHRGLDETGKPKCPTFWRLRECPGLLGEF